MEQRMKSTIRMPFNLFVLVLAIEYGFKLFVLVLLVHKNFKKKTYFQLVQSNNNYHKIPELYEERLSCNMPLEHFIYANRDPLMEPTRSECLSIGKTTLSLESRNNKILGCCWEEDDSVIDEFPMLPRCYRVERNGAMANRPNLDDLVMRSADLNVV